jgi:ribonucleoside-diphosphate reductase alpha chain
LSDIYWLNDDSRKFLSRGYLVEGDTPENRIRVIAETAERILMGMSNGTPKILEGFADKFESYMHKGWISLASPVWSNFGTDRGLPISCNGSYYEDSVTSILYKTAEIGMMTKLGAGTSAYIGAIRPRGTPVKSGGTADGPVHYAELIQSHVNVISQANVRRGNCAIYLDVEHADIEEFLECREEGHSIQHLSIGVCISDAWMEDMLDKASDTGKKKRKIWLRILKKRAETGYPYIFFTDTVNNNAPQVYRDLKIKIHASNLCTEIALASGPSPLAADEWWSFVCCLSSLNALHYDEWKDTDLVEVMTYFLDAVMEEYIQKTADIPFMKAAHQFAKDQRAIGLGVLGWHSLLQSRMLPFASIEAKKLNVEIHRLINEKSLAASQEMALYFGEPPLLKGYGERNVTRMAIAPTTSSSFILGQVSQGIEPQDSNYYTKDLQKGKFGYRNPFLKKVLKAHGRDNKETWDSILVHGGSVQHLDFLTDNEREVFKTFGEIDQGEIIAQAAHRQKFIDQAQSLNIKIHPDAPIKDVNALMIAGWRAGVKSYYYQRSTNPSQEFVRSLLSCKSCEA